MERFIPYVVCCCALAMFLLAGCSSKPSSEEEQASDPFQQVLMTLADSIPDPQRSAQARDLVSQVIDAERQHLADIDATRESWVTLFANYDSTKQDFEPIYSEFLLKRQELAKRLVDFSLRLRDTMTPEEWEASHERIAAILKEK